MVSRDNIPGVRPRSMLVRLFLLPGMVWQWTLYVGQLGLTRAQSLRNTRMARSPFMTWVYSIIFWAFVAFVAWSHAREHWLR